jgi:hypothetical protein
VTDRQPRPAAVRRSDAQDSEDSKVGNGVARGAARPWWRRAGGKALAGLAAVAVVLGNWDTVTEKASELVGLWQDRQPQKDERILASLRTGVSDAQFVKDIGAEPQAVFPPKIPLPGTDYSPVVGQLFILPTVYVEAFVDQDDQVRAYTVTARTDDLPVVQTPAGAVQLGVTGLLKAVGDRPVHGLLSQCTTRDLAYFEVTVADGASRYQAFAFGTTVSGALPDDYSMPGCPPGDLLVAQPPFPLPDGTASDDQFAVSATPGLLASMADYRASLVVNAVTVGDPGVPVLPEMLLLSTDTLAGVDPDR